MNPIDELGREFGQVLSDLEAIQATTCLSYKDILAARPELKARYDACKRKQKEVTQTKGVTI